MEYRFNLALEEQARDTSRNTTNDQIPGKPPVYVGANSPLDNAS
jgi:hypothetical protein